MIWVGTSMGHHGGGRTRIDPALINPRLTLDMRSPDWDGHTIGYWPAYADINPRQRAAYLSWLAHGRRAPNVSISYVFLYFYGLERRVLDIADLRVAAQPASQTDLRAIEQELAGLRAVYGSPAAPEHAPNSFERYASALAAVVDAMLAGTSPDLPPVPALEPNTWQIPALVRVALGRMARDGVPLSPEWALTWARLHPEIYDRTPQRRCPGEFAALFKARYAGLYPRGLPIRSVRKRLTIDYLPATSVTTTAQVSLDVPDVAEQERPVAAMRALVEQANNDLDAFSRWVGRHPDDKTSLAALATLPSELLNPDGNAALARLLEWARGALPAGGYAVVDSRTPLALWGAVKFGKADAVALANLLEHLGFGIEPDVRCGGPTLAPGPMVVFQAAPDVPSVAGLGYAAATLIAHLGVAVAAADGRVDDRELDRIAAQLRGAIDMSQGERLRLTAHIAWLAAAGVKLTGLKKRLEPLTSGERESLADFVAAVAAADGVVTATESTVDRIHVLLGLDPTSAARRLHEAMSTAAPTRPPDADTGPVTIRLGTPPPPGQPIPPAPAQSYAARHAGPCSAPPTTPDFPNSGFVLDESVIAARRADTERVASLLGQIFDDEDEQDGDSGIDPQAQKHPDDEDHSGVYQRAEPVVSPPTRPRPVPNGAAVEPVSTGRTEPPHLSPADRALVEVLAQRNSWYRVEFDREAGTLGLDPDPTLDRLNAAAEQRCGHVLLTGEHRLMIDLSACTALLEPARPRPAPTAQGQPPAPAPPPAPGGIDSGPPGNASALAPAGSEALDDAHNALLSALATQPSWYRVHFEALAAEHGLLPDAALEALNEAALDACDDLLLDGDEQLRVNDYALKGLLT